MPSRRAFLRSGASVLAAAGLAGCVDPRDAVDLPDGIDPPDPPGPLDDVELPVDLESVGGNGITEPIDGEVRQQQADGARSGRIEGVGGPRREASVAWSTDVGDRVDYSPVVRDSRVFVGATRGTEGVVRALDAASGNALWTERIEDGPALALTEHGLIASDGFDTYHLSETRGSTTDSAATAGSSALALDRERAYFFGTSSLHAVPQNFERQGWSTALERGASGPAVSGGRVYVGTYDDGLRAYTTDGDLDWRVDVGRDVTGAPTVGAGLAIVGAVDFAVHAFDRETGDRRWRHETGGAIYGSPAVAGDAVYVTSVDGTVRALDAADGREQWRYDAGDGLETGYRAGPIVDDATVYVGGIGGEITALDRTDGDELWTVDVGSTPVAPPTMAQGHVFVGTVDGTVYAIDGEVSP